MVMKAKVIRIPQEEGFVPGGIGSKTLHREMNHKSVLFSFDVGQQLSEHTATVHASMHFLEGEAEVTLGDEKVAATPGTLVFMKPGLVHAISAKTKVLMLLTLFPVS